MRCPRRDDMNATFGLAPGTADTGDGFSTKDGACSYCGSMNDVEFMSQVRGGHVELTPTDKNYKVYVREIGPNPLHAERKFYFQHLSQDAQREFVDLLNAGKLRLGDPGHFYVRPFFIQRPSRT